MPLDMFFVRPYEQVQAILNPKRAICGPIQAPIFVMVEWPGRGTYEGVSYPLDSCAYADSIDEGLSVVQRFKHNAAGLRVHVLADGPEDDFMLGLRDRDPSVKLVMLPDAPSLHLG